MKRLTFLLVALAAATSAAFCVLCAPTVTAKRAGLRLVTREVSLGRLQADELRGTRTVSPDRRRIAFVAKVEGGEAAYVDGVKGKTYPAVASDPLSEAGLGSPFTFSRDSRRVAYVVNLSKAAHARGPRRVVVDGTEGPSFDYIWSGGLHFSDDGKHFAYTAERGDKRFVVVDGAESAPYERVTTPASREYKDRGFVVAFDAVRDGRQLFVVNGQEFAAGDPKGRELFFGAEAGQPHDVVRNGKHFVVWGDKELGPFDEPIWSSLHTESRADGSWLVTFEGTRGGKQIAVVDGVEGKPYDYVGPIHVSPGGAHTLYPARSGKKAFVVFDGKEGPKFDNVNIDYSVSPFSPDGKHYAYAASRDVPSDIEFLVVTDGREGRLYDFINGVTYTPDGADLLYIAYDKSRRKTFLVRDGEEVGAYDNLPEGDIRFGPGGKRMYFRLRSLEEKGQEAVVVDGRAFNYDNILDVEFSPDGRRFVLKGQRGRGWVMVVDGVESETYEPDGARGELVWSRDGRLAFSKEGGRMAYVGRKGGKDFVILDGAKAPATYDAVANLSFTPDDRHLVYTARRGGKSLVVVDSVEGREYDAFLPARESEREGTLNVEGNATLSILARRGSELLRVEIELVEE
jgi:hypothetical protein